MSYLSLYRKWRPGTFAEVLGQEHVTETLSSALREDRVAHAYLFSGPRGTGKTSTARILAKSLNCEKGPTPEPCGVCQSCKGITDGSSLDVYEMDAASHTSVDDVREIRDRIPFASAGGASKVYIIDEAHQLSTPAFNALLKMLEEPPPHVVFVLATTESHKLPGTVISRCQRFDFRRHSAELIAGHLEAVAKSEGMTTDSESLDLVARHANGSMRDALTLLDQAAGTADGVTRESIVDILGEAPSDALLDVTEAVAAQDVPGVFRRVEQMVDQGWDPRNVLRQLLEQCRALFLISQDAADLVEADELTLTRLREQAAKFTPAHLEWALRVLGEAQADVRASTHPRLTLEVALSRAACLQSDDSAVLLARVERLERLIAGREVAPVSVVSNPPATPSAVPDAKLTPPLPTPEPAAPQSEQGAPQPATPEPPTPVPTPEPVPVAAAPSGLEGQWDLILKEVLATSRVTYTHLKQGWPLGVREDSFIVGFEGAFHPEQVVKRPDQLARVITAIATVTGQKLRFAYEVGSQPAVETPAVATSAEGTSGAPPTPDELVRRGLGADLVEERES